MSVSSMFMPHGHCYLWKSDLVLMHAVSDSIIFLSYLAIPVMLAYVVYKTKFQIPYHHMFVLFSLFILACGVTHFIEIINIWRSEYYLSGIIKSITAVISLTTALALLPQVPKVIKLIQEYQKDDSKNI